MAPQLADCLDMNPGSYHLLTMMVWWFTSEPQLLITADRCKDQIRWKHRNDVVMTEALELDPGRVSGRVLAYHAQDLPITNSNTETQKNKKKR